MSRGRIDQLPAPLGSEDFDHVRGHGLHRGPRPWGPTDVPL